MSEYSLNIIWIVIGVLLSLLELATMSFILIFIGCSAIVVGILGLFLGALMSLNIQLAVFAVLATVSVLLFRKKVKGFLKGNIHSSTYTSNPDDMGIGERALVIEDITGASGMGKVEWRGSSWSASSSEQLSKGTEVTIIKRDNISVFVERRK